jgi:hypothetical protein
MPHAMKAKAARDKYFMCLTPIVDPICRKLFGGGASCSIGGLKKQQGFELTGVLVRWPGF